MCGKFGCLFLVFAGAPFLKPLPYTQSKIQSATVSVLSFRRVKCPGICKHLLYFYIGVYSVMSTHYCIWKVWKFYPRDFYPNGINILPEWNHCYTATLIYIANFTGFGCAQYKINWSKQIKARMVLRKNHNTYFKKTLFIRI